MPLPDKGLNFTPFTGALRQKLNLILALLSRQPSNFPNNASYQFL